MEANKQCKTVFDGGVANYLLDIGHKVMDIRANRSNTNQTLFVFECPDGFEADYQAALKYSKAKHDKDDKKYKTIFNPGVARHLISAGVPLAHVGRNTKNPDRSVFKFEVTEQFTQEFTKINEYLRSQKKADTYSAETADCVVTVY